ncbi:MAG: outer membrane beta-barrel protein [Caldithrix sp.]|nr:outer membrane beta-barrel protein [Caldithrix sp.]
MKPYALIVSMCIVLFGIHYSYGQTKVDSDTTAINTLQQGSWSMQFRITGNFTLNSFDGSNLAFKKHFAPQHAARLGITLHSGSGEREALQREGTQPPYTQKIKANTTSDQFKIDLKPLYVYYPYVHKRVSPFVGIGPYLSYHYDDSERDRDFFRQDTLFYREENNGSRREYNLGIAVVMGVEVFITDYLSVHAEYGSNLYYSMRKEENIRTVDYTHPDVYDLENRTESDDRFYYFSADNVLFGLSIYF